MSSRFFNFHDTCRWLRKHFPGEHPVMVRRLSSDRMPKDTDGRPLDGSTQMFANKDGSIHSFRIYIKKGMSHGDTITALWEEWAHYHRLHSPNVAGSEGHDEVFGSWYNRIKCKWDEE